VKSATGVQRAIEELRYTPNTMAQNLKYGRTQTIALVVPDITTPFFASVVKGAEGESQGLDYSVSLYNTDENEAREKEILSSLVGRVDGVILAPTTEAGHLSPALTDSGVPVVFIDRETSSATRRS